MSILTNVQFIEQNGKPAFAVIPYEEYLRLLPPEDVTIPHEVVGLVVRGGMTLVKAWRTYLELTQVQVAKKAGMSQAALSQMEKGEKNLRTETLKKLAAAMGLDVEQIRD